MSELFASSRVAAALAVGSLFTLVACSSNDGGHVDAPSCTVGPRVPRETLVNESVAYLRDAFSTTTGFDGGTVSYGEMRVSLDDECLYADWTSLNYVAPIASALVPVELRATYDRVAVVWALNGLKTIVYLPSAKITATDPAPWQSGMLPDNFNVPTAESASPEAANAFAQQLALEHPDLEIQWLDAIGVLTVVGTIGELVGGDGSAPKQKVSEVEAAAEEVRQSGLFMTLAWSAPVFRLPNDRWPAKLLDEDVLEPECLREETLPLRDANQLSTRPSLAKPLGDGAIDEPTACP